MLCSLCAWHLQAAPEPRPAPTVPVPTGAALPHWESPTTDPRQSRALSVHAGELELLQSRDNLGALVVRVAGQAVAVGQDHAMLGYIAKDRLQWLDLANGPERKLEFGGTRGSVQVTLQCSDTDGARWRVEHRFSPRPAPGAIDFEVEVAVDQDRAIAFMPMFLVFPGAGTFGSTKGQGLVAGVEYLDDEPSSSEADVVGPAARRQVPENYKITFPLMAIQQGDRYVALTWQMRPHFSALFDSPDRLFGSGGHVMGVIFPGSDGENRIPGTLLPKAAPLLRAGSPLLLRGTLMGGRGKSVVPAIAQYVSLHPLPPLPVAPTLSQYVSLTAGGWLDSKIRDNSLFHHAIAGGNFPATPAADAAVWMHWLAENGAEAALSQRLKETATNVLAVITPAELNLAGVGHVRYPVASLLFGHVEETADRAGRLGRDLLGRFESDGSIRYHPREGGPDFAKTHSSNEADGLTSRTVLDLLDAAAFSGEPELLQAGVARLRAMGKFRNGVPRGAQTWECPLHTPDILASAQLVRAFTLGYELTGDSDFLEQARYWAWTGVPFVYLVGPTPNAVGLYGTIAVFGATQWKAPVWMGLPVQWCGLVYADALYRLSRHDTQGPWKKLADGIAVSGIQQSWPSTETDLQGLLPDSFVLKTQHRNGPAINPATVQACATRLYSEVPVYEFWCFRKNGLRVHAPGAILATEEKPGRVAFQVVPWVKQPCFVLINGLRDVPQIKLNGEMKSCSAPNQFQPQKGRLILEVRGKTGVELLLNH